METRFPKDMKATLKSIREMRGYKQEEAAKLIGIATDTLRNYEQGKSYPDIPVLRKIEETYNVRYSQIIFLPLDFGLTEKMCIRDRIITFHFLFLRGIHMIS